MNAATPNSGEAAQALADLNRIMDRLTETIAEETARARTGQLAAAAKLSESKLELARLYAAESERMKAASSMRGPTCAMNCVSATPRSKLCCTPI